MTLKSINIGLVLILGLFIYNGQTLVFGQSNLKEGNNNFALYTKSGDFKKLEAARKHSDGAYSTPKDSVSYKNNLLRALVYSSLAVADSSRKLKYSDDPIQVAIHSFKLLNDKNLNYENEGEITFIRRKIAHAYQINARRALTNNDYQKALDNFLQVDDYSNGEIQVKKNLAVLSDKLDKKPLAIIYYKEYLKTQPQSTVEDFLILSKLYEDTGNENEAINTLLGGLDSYPKDKNMLFKLINIYSDKGIYGAVLNHVEDAISIDPENVKLNYLAGYANEVTGNTNNAEKYYRRVISLDENNFNGNLELGLLHLKSFLINSESESQDLATTYLLKANEIDPTAVNALKALAVLFKESGDAFQYERVQNQLNKDIIN